MLFVKGFSVFCLFLQYNKNSILLGIQFIDFLKNENFYPYLILQTKMSEIITFDSFSPNLNSSQMIKIHGAYEHLERMGVETEYVNTY